MRPARHGWAHFDPIMSDAVGAIDESSISNQARGRETPGVLEMGGADLERILRRAFVAWAILGLAAGVIAYAVQRPVFADLAWTTATVPVIVGLALSIAYDLWRGRMGVDAIALVSMSGALALGQPLAGAVGALMYAGGNVLEDMAIVRAQRDLHSLVDRAPRTAHRYGGERIEDVPVGDVGIGDRILVCAGEII